MPAKTTVRDLMTAEVATLRPDQKVEEAADLLAARKIGAAPVVDAADRLLGLLRDEDLLVSEARLHAPTIISFLDAEIVLPSSLHRFERELKKFAGSTVADVMQSDPKTASADDSVESLATLMHDHEVSHVPVVDDDGVLVGIVARGDLVRFVAATT